MGRLVGLKAKTIPYATVDDKRAHPFTSDLELASLFVLAEARRGRKPLSAIARVYYPLHIHPWEGGALLIDLLGLNYASVSYSAIPDVEEFVRALGTSLEDPKTFREVLRDKGSIFKKFAGRKTMRINGLIQPSESAELSEFLMNLSDFPMDEPVVFEPVLKSGEIESIIGSIYSLRDAIEIDLKSLAKAKRSLRDALDIGKKVLNEEIQNIRDRSSKVKARMRRAFEKTKAKFGKAIEVELRKIMKEYRRKADPIRRERTSLKRKIDRRRRKLNLLKDAKDEQAVEDLSREIEKLEAKFNEADRAVRSLEAWRDAEVKKVRAQYKDDIDSEANKIREEEVRCRDEIKRRRADIKELGTEVKRVAAMIDKLVRSKKNKQRSMSKLCFDMEAETVDLYIPFYIFRYGEKFDFYPPVEASESKGLLSRFKRMLADNLQSKIIMLIKPRAAFPEKYLAKAVRGLRRDRNLSTAYRGAAERLNLLRSREAVDKIMTGLVKIRREGWISDSEYIRLQENLVDNLGLISRP